MSLLKKIRDSIMKLFIKMDNGFLCDTCMFNDPRSCSKPERPNAKECDEPSNLTEAAASSVYAPPR